MDNSLTAEQKKSARGNHKHLNYHQVIIIGTQSSPLLSRLEKRLADVKCFGEKSLYSIMNPVHKKFKNGEFHSHISGSVRDADVYVLAQPRNTEEHLSKDILDICQMLRSCRTGMAHRVHLLLPLMPYSRQDRSTRDREFASFRLMCDLLLTAGLNTVTTFELHNDATVGYMAFELSNQSTLAFLAKRIRRNIIESFPGQCHLIAPDTGSAKYIERLRSELSKENYGFQKLSYSIVQKDRDPSTGGTQILGVSTPSGMSLEGTHCIIVDDMIDTGGTAAKAARYLRDTYGVAKVSLVATHGIFSKGAREELSKGEFDRICVTDTCPLPEEMKGFSGLTVWSVDGYLADLVFNIHNGKSSIELARVGGSDDDN